MILVIRSSQVRTCGSLFLQVGGVEQLDVAMVSFRGNTPFKLVIDL